MACLKHHPDLDGGEGNDVARHLCASVHLLVRAYSCVCDARVRVRVSAMRVCGARVRELYELCLRFIVVSASYSFARACTHVCLHSLPQIKLSFDQGTREIVPEFLPFWPLPR